jgi:S-layer homology domain
VTYPSILALLKYIQKMMEITSGCSTNRARYCPSDPVERAQAAVFLIRARFGPQFPFQGTSYFADISSSDPRSPFIQRVRELGIIDACAPREYCGSAPVTRAEMAMFLTRTFITQYGR